MKYSDYRKKYSRVKLIEGIDKDQFQGTTLNDDGQWELLATVDEEDLEKEFIALQEKLPDYYFRVRGNPDEDLTEFLRGFDSE